MERLTRKERTRTGKGVSKEPLIDRDFDRLSEYCINILTKLADYENLEEQGRLLVLPCKIGDRLHWIDDEDDDGNEGLCITKKYKLLELTKTVTFL